MCIVCIDICSFPTPHTLCSSHVLLSPWGGGGSGVEEAIDDDDDMGMNDEGVSGTEHGDDDEVRRIKDIHM